MVSSTKDVIQITAFPEHFHKLGSPANDFIENRLTATVHPMFSTLDPPAYRDEKGGYLADPGGTVQDTAKMKQQSEKFEAAVDRFMDKFGKGKGIPYDRSLSYDWPEVIKELQQANERYDFKEEGFWGSLTRCLHNFSRYKGSVESWLHMLPTQSWQTSLVCGGIKIVFAAAARLGQIRKDIATALEQIPVTIAKVHEYDETYTPAIRRQEYVAQLFIVLLELLEQCLNWFATNPFTRVFKVLTLNDQYGLELKEKYDRFRALEQRIDDQASIQMGRAVRLIELQGQRIEEGTQQMSSCKWCSEYRPKIGAKLTKVKGYMKSFEGSLMISIA